MRLGGAVVDTLEVVFVDCGVCGWHRSCADSREAKAAATTHAARHRGVRVDELGSWVKARA